MPILQTDIKFRYSAPAASAGNATAQANPNAALGKYMSSTEFVGGSLNDLFDDVTGDENQAQESEYRCIFVHNTHATLALQNAVAWLTAQVTGGANVTIGVDPTASTLHNSTSVQAVTVANEDTAPAGVTFSGPTTKLTGISLGSIPANSCRGIWVKRTATASSALDNDGFTLRVEGQTAQ
jgi:hypothetical protein